MTLAFPHPVRRTPAPDTSPRPAPPPVPVHDARSLTGREGTAQILLDGQTYCLRITRAGKLILTK
ncbi:MAG TPA: hemin uptake protein HemP [Paracoccaceae bacterium]|nr:hemin uptake protein HemP [Paracoccaceae bacterium]HMO73377.1 hemin uptake protein HemP [Paracoccaceae bacterium]